MPQGSRSSHLLAIPLVLAGLFLSSLACSGLSFAAPTATPTATSTPTFTATPTATETPTVTLTPTRTITPTVSYLDWPIVFSDTFDDKYGGWFIGTDSSEYAITDLSIKDGKYVVKVTAKKSVFLRFYADAGYLEDFYVSVEVKKNKGSDEADAGLVVRSADTECYSFIMNATKKQYRFDILYDDEWEGVIRWTRSTLIDPSGSNQLAVLARGSQITLFINGEEVETIEDDTLDKGRVGVGIGLAKAGDTVELEFDNFDLTAPKKNR